MKKQLVSSNKLNSKKPAKKKVAFVYKKDLNSRSLTKLVRNMAPALIELAKR